MKNHYFIYFFILSFLFVNCSSDSSDPTDNDPVIHGEFIDDWTYSVFPNLITGNNYDIAEFRLNIPENVIPRAILVLTHSYNGNGLSVGQQTEWKEFAEKEKLAIISVNLKNLSNKNYPNANNGSGDALLFALNEICKKNEISEVNSLPFLMRGYSAGGIFSLYFSEFKPNRVLAFSNIRGGALPNDASDVNKNIPGLMIAGENDSSSRNNAILNAVISNRQKNGLWSFVLEPKANHYASLVNSDKLTRLFFSSVLKKRLIQNSNTLNPIEVNSGFLGNNQDKTYATFEAYPTNKNNASWLINNAFAVEWNKFQVD